ncbi:hypothetical protein [Nocardioides rubriscoriae]|uniref:hypothetical protein n=1 Tax=Nocardioides rubriscoriae TaxID=642762 RepID=UPI0011E021DF|nr:hypothetical protein [Nocardioides rubriscoriae]
MTDEVVTPHDVLADGIGDTLVEAMIEAWMRKGAIESGACNLTWDGKDGDDWVYRLPLSGTGDPEIVCDSGGSWRQRKRFYFDKDLGPGEGLVDSGENSYAVRLFDAPATWAEIRAEAESWVYPWVHDSPDPHDFTDQINSVATVARQLYAGSSPTGGGVGAPPTSADPDLWDALTEVAISADSTSLAVDAFQRTYATDIGKTIGGQYAMVYSAGLALTAEAAAWSASYKSLREFLKVAAADFNAFAGSGKGSGEDAAAVLGATSAVAGLLGATAGVAFPPFGLAMGLLSSSIGVYTVVNPASPAVADTSLLLEGDTYEAKWESFRSRIRDISADLRTAEEAVADACRAMVVDVNGFPDNYSLTRGGTQQGAGDDFEGMLGTTIDIQPAKLRMVAGACEAIGNHQIGLAGILGGSDAAGAPSSDAYGEWLRGSLPVGGTIGYPFAGGYWSYRALVDAIVDLLVEEGKNSRRVADWVIEMVLGMESTDAEREAALLRLGQQFDRHDLALGNDPTNPTSISST